MMMMMMMMMMMVFLNLPNEDDDLVPLGPYFGKEAHPLHTIQSCLFYWLSHCEEE
jgi:hypothetical protein